MNKAALNQKRYVNPTAGPAMQFYLPAPAIVKKAVQNDDFADVLILKKKERLVSAVSNNSNGTASTGILGVPPTGMHS
jgi:hypothetical protein